MRSRTGHLLPILPASPIGLQSPSPYNAATAENATIPPSHPTTYSILILGDGLSPRDRLKGPPHRRINAVTDEMHAPVGEDHGDPARMMAGKNGEIRTVGDLAAEHRA